MFKKQSGAVLVTTMIILFTLTFLVLSSSQSGVIQEKMTAAVRDAHISLEIAESGLKDAEGVVAGLVIDDLSNKFDSSGTKGFYSEGSGPEDLFDLDNWKAANTSPAGTSISEQKALYFVEYIGLLPITAADYDTVTITGYGETTVQNEAHIFKIVSRALGNSGNSERILVSYYSKNL